MYLFERFHGHDEAILKSEMSPLNLKVPSIGIYTICSLQRVTELIAFTTSSTVLGGVANAGLV